MQHGRELQNMFFSKLTLGHIQKPGKYFETKGIKHAALNKVDNTLHTMPKNPEYNFTFQMDQGHHV